MCIKVYTNEDPGCDLTRGTPKNWVSVLVNLSEYTMMDRAWDHPNAEQSFDDMCDAAFSTGALSAAHHDVLTDDLARLGEDSLVLRAAKMLCFIASGTIMEDAEGL